MIDADPFDLDRFVEAQRPDFDRALQELRAGRKRTHWMWYVFPQLRGLGHTAMAAEYGIASLEEARAYLTHPVLGPRLLQATTTVLGHRDRTLRDIFGSPDDLKFGSSMTLFARAHPDPATPFRAALDLFLGGQGDPMTIRLLGG